MINSEYHNGEGDKLPRVARYTRDFFLMSLRRSSPAEFHKDPSVLRGWIKFSWTHTRMHLLKGTYVGLAGNRFSRELSYSLGEHEVRSGCACEDNGAMRATRAARERTKERFPLRAQDSLAYGGSSWREGVKFWIDVTSLRRERRK